MTGEDALRLTGVVGERIIKERDARRDLTALVIVVADLTDWDTASDFAGALGLEGHQQEEIFHSWTKDRTP